MTPAQLIEGTSSGKFRPDLATGEWLMSKRSLAPGTRRVYRAAVKKFFDVCLPDLEFRWNKVQVGRMRVLEVDRAPTKNELLRMMMAAGLKSKVLLTFLTSSGVRRGTLAGLKLKHLDLETYPDVGVVRVPAELNKARIPYVTFISSQCRAVLKEYLRVREQGVRKSPEVLTPDSPVIAIAGRPVKPKSVSELWVAMVDRAGLGEKPRRYRTLRTHTARKYFATMLSIAGVHPSTRERLMGHFSGYANPALSMDSNYFRPDEEQLLDAYRAAMPKLIIAEEVGTEEFRKKQAMDALKMLGYPEEKLKKVENLLAKARSLDDVLDEVRKMTSSDQKIVDQSELDEYLATGWEPVMRLENKKIVIKRSAGI
jgi:site-specific recombinase XerC